MVLVAGTFLPAAMASAQSVAPIVTDRPTQSAATFVISPKVFQIESGYRFTRAEDAAGVVTDVHRLPDALFRFGIVDWAEARLTVSGADIMMNAGVTGTERTTGFNDISLGAKFAVADERGARPAFSILADVTLPVGSEELSSDFVSPKLLALLSSTLSDRWTLTANIGPTVLRDSGKTVVDLEYAMAIGATMSSRFALFSELYGAFALSDSRTHQHSLQTGVTTLLGSDVQLDARVGFGFVESVPDWLVGFGLSWRLFSSNTRMQPAKAYALAIVPDSKEIWVSRPSPWCPITCLRLGNEDRRLHYRVPHRVPHPRAHPHAPAAARAPGSFPAASGRTAVRLRFHPTATPSHPICACASPPNALRRLGSRFAHPIRRGNTFSMLGIRSCCRFRMIPTGYNSLELLPFVNSEKATSYPSVWRQHRGLSVKALAESAGIAPAYLSQIETGKRDGTLSTIKKIADALDVSVDDLVG